MSGAADQMDTLEHLERDADEGAWAEAVRAMAAAGFVEGTPVLSATRPSDASSTRVDIAAPADPGPFLRCGISPAISFYRQEQGRPPAASRTGPLGGSGFSTISSLEYARACDERYRSCRREATRQGFCLLDLASAVDVPEGAIVTLARIAAPLDARRLVASGVMPALCFYAPGEIALPAVAISGELRTWSGGRWRRWPALGWGTPGRASSQSGRRLVTGTALSMVDEIVLIVRDGVSEAAAAGDRMAARHHERRLLALSAELCSVADMTYADVGRHLVMPGDAPECPRVSAEEAEYVSLCKMSDEVAFLGTQSFVAAAAGAVCAAWWIVSDAEWLADSLRSSIAASRRLRVAAA